LAYDGDEVVFATCDDSRGGRVSAQSTRHITVKTVSLDKLARGRGFTRFNLVCDIEGSEVDLVAREKDLMAAAVDTFILEIHPKLTGEAKTTSMLSDLKNLGFETLNENCGTVVLKNARRW
jgi:hypothetical protein